MNIDSINGVGPVLLKKLNNLNIITINDLVEYYPYRYEFYELMNLNVASKMDNSMIKATVVSDASVQYIKKSLNRLSFRCICENHLINVTIFNRAFLKQHIKVNKEIVLIGKYNKIKNSFLASEIKFNIENNRIEPVYHLMNGIKSSDITKLIPDALKKHTVIDYLPDKYVLKYQLLYKNAALRIIHLPSNIEEVKLAQKRLKYEELFTFLFKINYLKKLNTKTKGILRNIENTAIDEFIASVPFTLTVDQIKAINDIYQDLNSINRMNRLVLGDVGSGKTVVATYAIYHNYLSNYQTALMAPTEILAEQHYQKLSKHLAKFNINVAYLVGSMKKREKERIIENLKNGTIDVVIGTHALISENVNFHNLGLIIVDEQHRFGVGQRNTLRDKGKIPDVLYLSATPIPRTYALTIYGDLDISIIKSKPQNRIDIETKVLKINDLKSALYKILEEIKKGHQIYVVSPLIENNLENDMLSVLDLKEKLNMAFQNKINIAVIHGKLKKDEIENIMTDYKNGIIKILISTTVIEVGIDNPNATVMMIYNAERFGLATLHQLRGRVGRGEFASFCYLISNQEIDRLKVLEETNDGFLIAEKDFQLRGHGDLFGNKQSGEASFKIANLKEDYEILLRAKVDSLEYIESNEYLNNDYYKDIVEEISFIN